MSAVLKPQTAVDFALEPVAGLWEELRPLTQAHWQEIAWFKDDIPLSPDVATYEAMDAAGALRVFTARDGGQLVGYAVYVISRPLHYDILQAFCDVVFMREDYRRGHVAMQFLDYAECACVAAGAKLVCYHGKVNTAGFSKLMQAREFVAMDTIYVRRF